MLLVILTVRKITTKRLAKIKSNRVYRLKINERKSGKLYVKWKCYHNSFNNWIDKKGLVEMSKYLPNPKPVGLMWKLN